MSSYSHFCHLCTGIAAQADVFWELLKHPAPATAIQPLPQQSSAIKVHLWRKELCRNGHMKKASGFQASWSVVVPL